ncbi:hypothetical protein TRFO_31616 [Tritrichomonas foetus]|uniref:LMBR1-like conserved region family protein n=1 Tax=Tritrichomonas foetus TaxID=1144522 RepID=A0A1J4JR63_9EUKA|nr:hypothetical protein TRFO_31616 [Tritrichomonas foetus]|eukprot:OHT01523.1 hypothetical protein TRFO_31616 [Tritrichomonas foetus]
MVDLGIITTVVISVAVVLLVIYFFYAHGVFKLPPFSCGLMLINAIIPFIMCIGILPYDISRCLFGSATTENFALRMTLEVFYWVSFVLTWAVGPIAVSYLRYSYSISLKYRIWFTIRENLIFYGSVLGVVVIGVAILLGTHQMTIENLFPLAISLANGYGLLVLCLCWGHGLVALPKTIWQMADPVNAYLFYLNQIANETALCARTIADGDIALTHCTTARDHLTGEMKELYDKVGNDRMIRLSQLKGELPIPDRCLNGESTDKRLKALESYDWEKCTNKQLMDFFHVLDNCIEHIEQTTSFVQDSSKQAFKALKAYEKRSTVTIILKRSLAIFVVLINAVCTWSEVALTFNNKFSLFYIISHIEMPQIVSILLVSTPILTYLICLGAWSLTHLRLGSFFRFIKGATNANTLNYFAIILCRLGPTAGFHYMQQIGAYDSEFQKVMGKMNVVVFIGTKWNIYAPVLMLVIMVIVAFNIIERIAKCCGKKVFSFDTTSMNYDDLAIGEEVLCEMEHEAKELIEEEGLRYSVIANKKSKPTPTRFKATNDTEEQLAQALNDL